MTAVTKAPMVQRQLSAFRKTKQVLAPAEQRSASDDSYCLYPAFPLEPGAVGAGFDALAQAIDRVPAGANRWLCRSILGAIPSAVAEGLGATWRRRHVDRRFSGPKSCRRHRIACRSRFSAATIRYLARGSTAG